VIPSYACATMNMFDLASGLRGGKVERELHLTGRARSADHCGLEIGRCLDGQPRR
jgi:hypothetical protein